MKSAVTTLAFVLTLGAAFSATAGERYPLPAFDSAGPAKSRMQVQNETTATGAIGYGEKFIGDAAPAASPRSTAQVRAEGRSAIETNRTSVDFAA
jgi:hypothetical protein